MDERKPDSLMPYATPDMIRELVTLVDQLLSEVGNVDLGHYYYREEMDYDEELSGVYNKIINALSTVRNEMTEAPVEPDKPEGQLMRRADGTLYIKGFFDDEK